MGPRSKPSEGAAPFRAATYMERDLVVGTRPSGEVIVACRQPLQPYMDHVPAVLARQAQAREGETWLAQREGADRAWRRLNYGEAKRQVDALTQGLLDLELAQGAPVMILSGNSIEHALFALAAMQARHPVAPISPSYALASQDHAKLKAMAKLVAPAAIFVQDLEAFAPALRALGDLGAKIIHARGDAPDIASTPLDALLAREPTDAVARSVALIEPDTVAKLMFTSGSTDEAKAVVMTQKMLCANIAMFQQLTPPQPEQPSPILLDWLPWSHVMGGNAVFNNVLADGGTLYIDEGRPAPGLFQETLRNLREVSPTRYSNVPAGFAMLTAALEADPDLARSFFKNLMTIGYAGARLPDEINARFQALAVANTGHRLSFTSGYGATEMGPAGTFVYWQTDKVGLIGLPHPGVSLKLVPLDDGRYEVRLRSEGMASQYYKMPAQTAAAFDEEGYFRTGDAAAFVDASNPNEGFAFCGRIAEEFKLLTGTFVKVGALRLEVLDACPMIMDAVVTGPDRPYVGLLAWPRPGASDLEQVTRDFAAALSKYNRDHSGSSKRIERALLLTTPPSIDAGEITDKGYINQRGVLKRRAAEVERLYAATPDREVIVLDASER